MSTRHELTKEIRVTMDAMLRHLSEINRCLDDGEALDMVALGNYLVAHVGSLTKQIQEWRDVPRTALRRVICRTCRISLGVEIPLTEDIQKAKRLAAVKAGWQVSRQSCDDLGTRETCNILPDGFWAWCPLHREMSDPYSVLGCAFEECDNALTVPNTGPLDVLTPQDRLELVREGWVVPVATGDDLGTEGIRDILCHECRHSPAIIRDVAKS